MEIYDSLKDIKFLDEYWKNNAEKYHIYLQKEDTKK